MTVKDALKVLPNNATIQIVHGCSAIKLIREDELMLDAYGDYLLDSIEAFSHEPEAISSYELRIVMRPMKA